MPTYSSVRMNTSTAFSVGGQGSDPILGFINVTNASLGTSLVIYGNAPAGSTANSRIIMNVGLGTVGCYQFGDLRIAGGMTIYCVGGFGSEAVVSYR
jgi:hypothetical protein